jgi:predicted DNA-binding transcriptional regulator YafY
VESSAARLLKLLSLLQSRPHWSATELADRLDVTTRTVRRDVTRLRDLGYPVEAEAGSNGGYQLGRGGALPPLLLTDDEAVAVAVGLRAAASGGVAGYDEAAVAALAKLEQVLPSRVRESVRALGTATMLFPTRGEAVDTEVLLTAAQGCRRNERMRFEYRDNSGNITHRRVEPYDLVNAEQRWYLVAHDLDRTDWRTFRLDRMNAPELTGHRFVRTSQPDAGRMVVDGLSRVRYEWQAEVLLLTSLEEAAMHVPPTVGSLEASRDGTILRLGANELGWIARYLAGLPFDCLIRSPDELRTEVLAIARRLHETHTLPRRSSREK